jgi:acetyltransferase-like isoleucine patch superfamily enzyme
MVNIFMIDNLSQEDLQRLATLLTPIISKNLTTTPSYYGSKGQVTCGNSVSLMNTFFNLSSGNVIIGDYTFFGNNVSVLTGTHDITKKDYERLRAPIKGRDVIIGKGVWIASCSVIIGPCNIGDYAVIAAGSVVLPGTYDAGCVYTGIPATLKKQIKFDDN